MILPKDEIRVGVVLLNNWPEVNKCHLQLVTNSIFKKKPQANNACIPKIKEGRPCSTHTSTTAKKESSHSLKS